MEEIKDFIKGLRRQLFNNTVFITDERVIDLGTGDVREMWDQIRFQTYIVEYYERN